MFWLVGYELAGVVAIIIMALYITVVLPYVCGYELDDWLDYVNEYLDADQFKQSKLEDCIGVALTLFLWPLKIMWLLCKFVPDMLNTYEAQFQED